MATIGSISGSTGAPATGQDTKKTTGSDDLGKDTFLKLLVAQLKYQDPSKPTDSTEFLSQTAQFTTVEKLDALTEATTAAANASTLQGATAVVGKKVTWSDKDGKDQTGVVDSVSIINGTPSLNIGANQIALTAVNKVENA